MIPPGWLLLAPLVLGAVSAAAVFALEQRRPGAARLVGAAALATELVLAFGALSSTAAGSPLAYHFAPWSGESGLTLVLDAGSAWMLLAAALCALLAFVSGSGKRAEAGRRHQSLLLVELLALDGMFLAADLASLFLCFALAWLLACATLAPRLRRTLVAGALVLGGVTAVIRATTGTLDFASLALVAPAIPVAESAWLTAAAFALLALLALAAAFAPLALWQSAASERAPAAALVLASALAASAVYAIMRLYTLVFPCFIAGPCGPSGLALPLGLSVVTTGALASLGVRRGRSFIACLTVVALGLALVAVGGFRAAGLAAGIYLLMQATLAGTAGLLALELVAERTTRRLPGGTALLFGLAVAALLCVPPLPGFLGAVALLRASLPDALAVWTLVLSAMLLMLIAAVRRGWPGRPAETYARPARRGEVAAATAAVGLLLVLGLAAGPALDYAGVAARQLLDRTAYVAAVGVARGRAAARAR